MPCTTKTTGALGRRKGFPNNCASARKWFTWMMSGRQAFTAPAVHSPREEKNTRLSHHAGNPSDSCRRYSPPPPIAGESSRKETRSMFIRLSFNSAPYAPLTKESQHHRNNAKFRKKPCLNNLYRVMAYNFSNFVSPFIVANTRTDSGQESL